MPSTSLVDASFSYFSVRSEAVILLARASTDAAVAALVDLGSPSGLAAASITLMPPAPASSQPPHVALEASLSFWTSEGQQVWCVENPLAAPC